MSNTRNDIIHKTPLAVSALLLLTVFIFFPFKAKASLEQEGIPDIIFCNDETQVTTYFLSNVTQVQNQVIYWNGNNNWILKYNIQGDYIVGDNPGDCEEKTFQDLYNQSSAYNLTSEETIMDFLDKDPERLYRMISPYLEQNNNNNYLNENTFWSILNEMARTNAWFFSITFAFALFIFGYFVIRY